MKIEDLKIFIKSTIDYFYKISGNEASAGVPRLLESDDQFLSEITSAIGIVGENHGAIYVTGPENFFRDVLLAFNPDAEANYDNILDAAGELANTIAGNAQQVFGQSLKISVPLIIKGEKPELHMREPRFIIPLRWKDHQFSLVIGINQK
jgi:chemotaxis protein CheX